MPFDATPGFGDDMIHRERLLQLCRVLDTISDSSFDLRDWSQQSLCRSVSCAVGWAMHDRWFRAEGLSSRDGSPAYDGITGWPAVRRFFDLDREAALWLFHAASYDRPTRANVQARIRAYAEDAPG